MTDTATQRLDRWKISLLDLTLRNRLLDVRDSKQAVPLEVATVDDLRALAAALDDGATFRLEPYRAPSIEDERAAEVVGKAAADALADRKLLSLATAAELDKRLVTIARAAAGALSDGGVHTLWLGAGLLRWYEDGADERAPESVRVAPLVLWPVELTRAGAGERYRLRLADEDPRLNATLLEKLRAEFGVALPAPEPAAEGAEPVDELDVAAVMARVAKAVAHKASWRVVPGLRLGIFSFAKFVMWTDLEGRADRLLENPLVAHLARGRGEAFGGDAALDTDGAEAGEPPTSALITPLDADGSQLGAIAAAAAGKTFVLQGPPGTGKSQTITNLICHCLAEGKSVLFVSEKMAALEVVQKRLHGAGLGDFCLELHSHKAKRKDVIDQLGRVLERSWRPAAPAAADGDKLDKLRSALDAYVAALHATGPLGKSVYQVLGRLVELRDAPKLPALAGSLAGLDAAGLARRRDAVAALAHAAQTLGDVASHPWRTSRLRQWQPSSAETIARALETAAAAAAALAAGVTRLAELVPGLRGGSAKELAALGALCAVAATSPRPTAELVGAVAERRDEGGGPPAAKPNEVAGKIAAIKARARGQDTDDPEPAEASRAVVPVRRPVPRPADPSKYLELARRHRALAAEVRARFRPDIDTVDVTALAATFRAWSERFLLWRFFALRRPRAAVRALLADKALPADGAVADELDKVAGERALRAALEAARSDAEKWFGAREPSAKDELDLERHERAIAWAHELATAFAACAVAEGTTRSAVWRALLAQVASTGDGAAALELGPFSAVAAAVGAWEAAEREVCQATGLTSLVEPGPDHLTRASARARALAPEVARLRDHVELVRAIDEAEAAGAPAVAPALESGAVAASDALAAWERASLLGHCDEQIAASPALAAFHGATHHANVAEFVELDRSTMVAAKARAIAALAERVPKISADAGGEVGVLLHELKKQRRHKPLRELFRQLPTLLPRLRPCLLMSPLSVAQYLDPTLPRFDLVVFDEASQIPTADAIGALARGERAIIVGDSRQLPPTRFFEVGGRSDEVDATAAAADDEYEELESVLDESVAARVPQLYLRWHYRSRHEDLISFSNQRYYDDRLYVFPTAAGRAAELGVSLRKLEGVYDRAGTRTNRVEAEAVVAEIVARLGDPVQQRRSIGVVTFSKAQQTLVEDLLDAALREAPELERFFTDAVAEPVLVKNLETVQGDERDVMLFCIGYGPDASGKVAMNFGPLNRDGGERRLNVAITRAREQLVVFTSLEPEQISDDVSAAGVRHLAEFLAYAKRGGGSAQPPSDAAPASPMCAAIAKDLEGRGHKVLHGVGCAGYRLDLAVVDPDDPRRYVLAIESDGPAYGAAKLARDRDRLRAQVLAQLGWRLYRVWALDFWADPDKELARVHSAVIAAIAAARQRRPAAAGANAASVAAKPADSGAVTSAAAPGASGAVAPGTDTPSAAVTRPVGAGSADRGAAVSAAVRGKESSRPSGANTVPVERREPTGPIGKAESLGITPYAIANIPAGRRTPDDLHTPKHAAEIGKVIEQVLAAEAPMRVGLLVRRVAAYFGIARVTDKVVDAVRAQLGGRATWGDEPDVVWRSGDDPKQRPPVRAQSSAPASKRDVDDVPLAELAEAARRIVERAVGIARPELGRELARLMGYGRATERVVERMEEAIGWAKEKGILVVEEERVTLP